MTGVLVVADPLGTLEPEVDATVGMMVAAQELADVWVCTPEDLAHLDGRVVARAARVTVRPRHRQGDHRWTAEPTWYDVHDRAVVDVVATAGLVVLRIDPPVDARYLHTTYLLDLVADAGVRVANHPAGVRALHEKLVALRFPDLCPATVVTPCPRHVQEFVARHGRAVVKPVDGFAGHDVWLLAPDASLPALAESATQGGRRHVIVQEFLPDVTAHGGGNKRLFVLDGEIVGAVLRRPDAGDFRIGAPSAGAVIDADDRRIVAALGPLLLQHGIALAGLDVIAGRLIEVNVTCPGGMAKTDALLGTDLSGAIVRRLLNASAPSGRPGPRPPHHPTSEGVLA